MRPEELYEIYCGMTAEQAGAFMMLYLGDEIHASRFKQLVDGGLVMRRQDPESKQGHAMTPAGWLILTRITSIKKSTFQGMAPDLTPEELDALASNVELLAQMKLPKAQGLRLTHLNALVTVARYPGIVMRRLLDFFQPDHVGLLIEHDLVGCKDAGIDPRSKYLPLYPLTAGLTILNWCLQQVKLEGEPYERPVAGDLPG